MTVQCTNFENGLTIVTDTMTHLQSAALGVWVNAGARAEASDEHGLAHLLEHMAFKGTSTRSASDIAEEIEAVGGEINAATSIENTGYYTRILADDVPLAVNILSDILQNARFDARDLEKEQHVILQEIGASFDTPEDIVFDRFQQAAFSDQPLGRSILGTPKSVESFTPGMISNYLNTHYLSDEIVISAAGGVNHDTLCSLVETDFSAIKSGHKPELPAAYYTGGTSVEHRDLQEVQVLLGFEGRSYQDEDFFAAQFLANVLGGGMSSRLFQELREQRGLCYSIYAFHWAFSDTGLFGLHAATGENNIDEFLPVILTQLKRVREDLKETELARTRAQMRAGLLMSLESPSSRASQLARHMMLFGRVISLDEQINRMEAVSVQDVKRLADAMFTTSRPTLALLGPTNDSMVPDDISTILRASG